MKSSLFIKQATGALFLFSVIFISAGKFSYWQGWVYVFTGLFMLALNYTIFRLDPGLESERSKPGNGIKKWDKLILGSISIFSIVLYSVAGLDSGRFHWSPDFHCPVYATGFVLTISGQLLFLVAQKQNKFFSSIVRIQTDRGHIVHESGLYKIVRHPGYLGSVIQTAGFPLLFGSLWSIIPACIVIIALIVRTSLEDKMLRKELKGYSEYARKTKYRLIPYLW